MNLTKELIEKIEADNKAYDDAKAKLERARAAIVENPFGERFRNVTRQCKVAAEMPELAAVLKAHPAYSLPELFPLLPDYGQRAVKETLESMKRDNED